MAQLTNSNNFAGDVVPILYEVLSTGFESKMKGLIRSEVGIASSRFLPNLKATASPIGAYAADVPSETATVAYTERELAVTASNVYMEFVPSNWLDIYPNFRSVDSMTNLALNPTVLRATLNVLSDAIGTQMESTIWQGDTGGTYTLFDGFNKKALADSNVIDVTNIGALTTSNVFDVLEDVYESIPAKFIGNPNFKIVMSTTDWRKAQIANLNAKSSLTGYMDNGTQQFYLGVPIVYTSGLPENTIFATLADTSINSNLVFGVWVDPDAEMAAARIMRKTNASDTWFIRINFKAGVQYVEGSHVVLYVGS